MGRLKDPKQLSKLMTYVLGRQPDEFGLVPDEDGFVRMKDFIKAISEEPGWGYVRKSHIHEVLITLPDKPFVVEDDRIKVVSALIKLKTVPGVVPPKLLYHCVRRKAYPVVCEKGIMPMGQHHVFLATNKELALRMGKRRDPRPVLLTVQAQRASEAGVEFSQQGDLIYMVGHVPARCFSGPPLPKDGKEDSREKKEPSTKPETMAGSFVLDMERSSELQKRKPRKKGAKKEIAWKKGARKMRRKRR